MMSLSFLITAVLVLVSAVAAMTWRNLIHCALSLAVTFLGLAALYLQLNAQFVGFAQVLVYVGAVAILIVFAVLLTRGAESDSGHVFSRTWLVGTGIALSAFAAIASVVFASKVIGGANTVPVSSVRQIGEQLMTTYVLPLEVIGLLLTVALIGAVVIAMPEERGSKAGGGRP